MKKLMVYMANINPYELFSNLLIILLASNGITRSFDWITINLQTLEQVSPLYMIMAQYMDIHSLGWIYMLFSITLLLSVFFKHEIGWLLLILGSLGSSVICILYGLFGSEFAVLNSTYYFMLISGIILILLTIIGGIQIWKLRKINKT